MGNVFKRFFSSEGPTYQFEILSVSHVSALIIILALCLIIFLLRKNIAYSKYENKFRQVLTFSLLLPLILFNIYHIYNNSWDIRSTLPLEFCRMSAILSAIMLITKNYSLYEIVYFWGLSGTIQALLTPGMDKYGFPHFLYFQYFSYHGLVIVAVFYMTFIVRFYPTHKSIWRVVIITSIYIIVIGIIDILLEGNYLYLFHKPTTSSIIDYLGPWPWYILSIGILAIICSYICYIPWVIINRYSKY